MNTLGNIIGLAILGAFGLFLVLAVAPPAWLVRRLRARDGAKKLARWASAASQLGLRPDAEGGFAGEIDGFQVRIGLSDDGKGETSIQGDVPTDLRFERANKNMTQRLNTGDPWLDAIVALFGDERAWLRVLGPEQKKNLEFLCSRCKARLSDGIIMVGESFDRKDGLLVPIQRAIGVAKSLRDASEFNDLFILTAAFAGASQSERVRALQVALAHLPDDPQFKEKFAALQGNTEDAASQIEVALASGDTQRLMELAASGASSVHLLLTTVGTMRGLWSDAEFYAEPALKSFDELLELRWQAWTQRVATPALEDGAQVIAANHVAYYASMSGDTAVREAISAAMRAIAR
jgi:hypothetical protein